ncbi:hypothetical protein V1525DRAFT_395480 [Lipomyces kononenkoae]|uniref:Uncharacterized protein n=1 Tax=Lipomyces kononenkoae TaxID=34357 RepID=A0ACC3T9G9_LIPKO
MAARRINKSATVDEPPSSIPPSYPDLPRDAKPSTQPSMQRNASGRESKILSQRPQGSRRPARKVGVKKLSSDMPSFEEFERSAVQEAMQTSTPSASKSAIDTDWLPFGTENGAARSEDSYTWGPVLDRSSRSGSTSVGRGSGEAPRLGFGQTRSTTSQLSTESSRSSTDSSSSTRFEHQRSISSDEYFGRNTLDPDQERQSIRRLDDFDDAPAISSDDYFGRSEDSNSYESNDYVERAKDTALRLAANADDEIENVKTYIGRSVNKITSAIWNARK